VRPVNQKWKTFITPKDIILAKETVGESDSNNVTKKITKKPKLIVESTDDKTLPDINSPK
jgi:hypothetical protein